MPYRLVTGDIGKFLLPKHGIPVDLVFGSPPYAKKMRRYAGLADKAPPADPHGWASWMLNATKLAAEWSRGYVMWVVDSPRVKTREGQVYLPAVELLTCMIHETPGLVLKTPIIWTKNAAPGGNQYPGHAWEKVIVCHQKGKKPWYNEAAIATVAKYDSGPSRQRKQDGTRVVSKRGVKKGASARPKDVLYVTVGGGHMGLVHPITGKIDLADSALSTGCSEAPFPWRLAHWFLRGFCPAYGTVMDPFMGTGTVGAAAVALDLGFVGCDLRGEQVDAAERRIKHAYAVFHPDRGPIHLPRENHE